MSTLKKNNVARHTSRKLGPPQCLHIFSDSESSAVLSQLTTQLFSSPETFGQTFVSYAAWCSEAAARPICFSLTTLLFCTLARQGEAAGLSPTSPPKSAPTGLCLWFLLCFGGLYRERLKMMQSRILLTTLGLWDTFIAIVMCRLCGRIIQATQSPLPSQH
jgi:hypothetical protein